MAEGENQLPVLDEVKEPKDRDITDRRDFGDVTDGFGGGGGIDRDIFVGDGMREGFQHDRHYEV